MAQMAVSSCDNMKATMPSVRTTRLGSLGYAIYTLWLFTFSDWKTLIVPMALLALANAKSGKFQIAVGETNGPVSWAEALSCMPVATTWLWLTTLVQDIANQRLPGSVKEDKINKPWRPLPAGRISAASSRIVLFYAVVISLGLSVFLGEAVVKACMLLICVVWLYNDLDGSSSSPIIRYALIACGYVAYGMGATAIAVTTRSEMGTANGHFSTQALTWFAIVWLSIFTTSHGQDFADMEGDRARGRLTLPLVCGEPAASWLFVVPVMFWTVAAPRYWHATWFPSNVVGQVVEVMLVLTSVMGALLVLCQPTKKQYKWVVKLWCLWTALLFMLPLASS